MQKEGPPLYAYMYMLSTLLLIHATFLILSNDPYKGKIKGINTDILTVLFSPSIGTDRQVIHQLSQEFFDER